METADDGSSSIAGGLDPMDHELARIDPDEVLETDFAPGGWDVWDVCAPPPRRRRATPDPFDHEDPARMLARAAATTIATWRLDRGMRQHEAARVLGVTQSWIPRIERGRGAVGIDLLARIAGVTGSAVDLRFGPSTAGRPVRRTVATGRAGRARLRLVVDGPEERSRRQSSWAPVASSRRPSRTPSRRRIAMPSRTPALRRIAMPSRTPSRGAIGSPSWTPSPGGIATPRVDRVPRG